MARRPLAASFALVREIGMAVNPRTLRGYSHKVRQFDAWCANRAVPAFPTVDATLATFLSELAGTYRFNTLRGFLSAVIFANRVAGVAFAPTLSLEVLSGIARVHGAGMDRRLPVDARDLARFAASCPQSASGRRDRALLLLGFCAALGSDDSVGLDYGTRGADACGQVLISSSGMRIEIIKPASMTTAARAIVKVLPRRDGLCAVAAVEHWLEAAQITGGPLFRRIDRWGHIGEGRLQAKAAPVIVRNIVLRAERAAGASEAAARCRAKRYAMTSLRSGFIKSALEVGASEERIATHLGYTSTQVLSDYRRRLVILRGHPTHAVLGRLGRSGRD